MTQRTRYWVRAAIPCPKRAGKIAHGRRIHPRRRARGDGNADTRGRTASRHDRAGGRHARHPATLSINPFPARFSPAARAAKPALSPLLVEPVRFAFRYLDAERWLVA